MREEPSQSGPELRRAFQTLVLSTETKAILRGSLNNKDNAQKLPGFTDILGLWCDWLPIKGNQNFNVIENPFPFPVTTMGEVPETRVVWEMLLEACRANLSVVQQRVLQFYEQWKKYDGLLYELRVDDELSKRRQEPHPDFFKSAFDEATSYFKDMGIGFYPRLIKHHIDVNANSARLAEENITSGKDKTRPIFHRCNASGSPRGIPGDWNLMLVERAYIYAENVPRIVELMNNDDDLKADIRYSYEDAWWMMIMRLHAWTMSVYWRDTEGIKIPSDYYDNPARVYIL